MLCTHHAEPSWQGMAAPEVLSVHGVADALPPSLPEPVATGCGRAMPSLPSCCAFTTQNPIESYCRHDGGSARAVPATVRATPRQSDAPVSTTATRCMTVPAC